MTEIPKSNIDETKHKLHRSHLVLNSVALDHIVAVHCTVGGVAQWLERWSYDGRTFPGLSHDVQLMGDLLGNSG